MDLPTCPSCGQSVLDDEPVSCPFCGAAMDGSSGPTKAKSKPAPVAKKKPAEKAPAKPKARPATKSAKAASGDDDPFDIAASPQARRAIACSPRRTKSRPTRVTCPMCDTRGYIPPSAVGKQVKCCNADCMVPLFTAPAPEDRNSRASAAPSRVSDQAAEQEEQLSRPVKKRSPMVMYGVVGVVLLVAGVGLKYYLDGTPADGGQYEALKTTILPVGGEDDDTADGDGTDVVTNEADDVRAHAVSLVDQMIQSAQMSVNRDKALCRRLTAEAFMRLGNSARADGELAQLLRVSHLHRRVDDYYRVTPLARNYWLAVRQGDQAAAETLHEFMQQDAETIPQSGLMAIDAAVSWGAVLVHRDQAGAAKELIKHLRIDNTVRSRTDQLDRGVWVACTMSSARRGQRSDSPVARLVWTNPMASAIAVELAVNEQWNLAVAWAMGWQDELVQSDLLSEVARQAMHVRAPAEVLGTIVEASKATAGTRQRVQAVLAQASDVRLQSAQDALLTETADTTEMPSLGQMFKYRTPDLMPLQQAARTQAALARSAALRSQTDIAARAIVQMCESTMKDLPPTAAVRRASRDLDQSPQSVQSTIRTYLGLSGSTSVSSEFRSYRRGLDRLAAATEARRMLLICLLCDVAAADGGASLNQALDQSELLTDELTLDPTCQLIAGEALLAGGDVPTLAAATSARIPRGSRTTEQPEDVLAPVWLSTIVAAGQSYDASLLKPLDSVTDLPGLRSCLQCRIGETLANRPETKATMMDALAAITNEVDRELALWTAAIWLTRGGKAEQIEAWTKERRLSATDRVLALSGIVSGLDLSAGEPSGDAP